MTYMHTFLKSIEPVMPPYVLTTYEWVSTLRRAARLDPTRDAVCRTLVEDWFYTDLPWALRGRAEKRRLKAAWRVLRTTRKVPHCLLNKTTHLHWCAKALAANDLPTALQQGMMELAHNYGGRYQTAFREVGFLAAMRSVMRRSCYAHVQMELFPTPQD